MTFRETRIAGASHLSTRFSFTLLPVSYIREPALYLFRSMTRAFFAAPRRRLFRPPVLSLISSLSLSRYSAPLLSHIQRAHTSLPRTLRTREFTSFTENARLHYFLSLISRLLRFFPLRRVIEYNADARSLFCEGYMTRSLLLLLFSRGCDVDCVVYPGVYVCVRVLHTHPGCGMKLKGNFFFRGDVMAWVWERSSFLEHKGGGRGRMGSKVRRASVGEDVMTGRRHGLFVGS